MPQDLNKIIRSDEKELILTGLRGSGLSYINNLLADDQNCCIVVSDEHLVAQYERDIKLFTSRPVYSFPGYEIPPYTPLSPDQNTTASRISTLYAINDEQEPYTLVISAEALMRRVIPRKHISEATELIIAEEEYDRDELVERLELLGYEHVSLVQGIGDFSVRGGIVDVFPPPFRTMAGELSDTPIRLDYFGDFIETIKTFDPVSQRSFSEINDAIFLPVTDNIRPIKGSEQHSQLLQQLREAAQNYNWQEKEYSRLREHLKNGSKFAGIEFFLPLFYQGEAGHSSSSIFDFLQDHTRLILVDPDAIKRSINLVGERIATNHEAALLKGSPALPPEKIFLLPDELKEYFNRFKRILCTDFTQSKSIQFDCGMANHQLLKQDISIQRRKRGLLAPLTDQILTWQESGDHVLLCCRSTKRAKNLHQLLQRFHHNIHILSGPVNLKELQTTYNATDLLLSDQPITSGFSFNKMHVLSESELFGEMRLGTRKKAAHQQGEPVLFTELKEGDTVVHRDHGLGIYLGLSSMEIQSVKNDFILLEYKDGDKLYLPVDRLNLISRYEGLSDNIPKIDKLGSQSWKTIKAKVKEEVWKVARELLEIYARREIKKGQLFSNPGSLYQELEESFPFDETPGQDKAITETVADLCSNKVMDRLICGDVGYGKTEVAVRAAFKVVEDGFQVAILVPTTVLAEQHSKTFIDRLREFPVTVGCINRFRTSSQQKKLVAGIDDGSIDILIGTHRLLSKDINFKKLGLLIIDEEHRFGVSHKEKIKKLRAEVDVLTLTATPIPRTLQMSLLGIRDLSVISSPPKHRRPVKTFVAQYDDLVIKEAVNKEMHRGGQVFFVHNRVKSIQQTAANLQKLVPKARIAVAHGQMDGKELEEIMVSFVNREIDLLLCTTIIESGLDIPTANTIIIDRADRLGLAEIYQLRGRVGRSSVQSFAFLLVPSLDSLSKESKERLRALMDYNQLGGGFKLAMSDLQIRGGGNLLGVSQSGHIAAIGYDLYLDLLQRTVADLKKSNDSSSSYQEELEPEVNLQLSAYIPEHYIHDVSQRYIIYRRISSLISDKTDAFNDLTEELEDRYGELPAETRNLFKVMSIKKQLRLLRISKLEKGGDTLVFSFLKDTPVSPEAILGYIQPSNHKRSSHPPRLTPDGRLVITAKFPSIQALFNTVEETISQLQKLIE